MIGRESILLLDQRYAVALCLVVNELLVISTFT